jgi:hypothetical protein
MKYIKTFAALNENQTLGRFKELPNGKLEISLDGSEDREEMEAFEGDDQDFLWEFFESELTNGFTLVPADQKGLTEAPMITTGVPDDDGNFGDDDAWYFNDYMLRSIKDDLLNDSKVIFDKA